VSIPNVRLGRKKTRGGAQKFELSYVTSTAAFAQVGAVGISTSNYGREGKEEGGWVEGGK